MKHGNKPTLLPTTTPNLIINKSTSLLLSSVHTSYSFWLNLDTEILCMMVDRSSFDPTCLNILEI